MAFPVTNHNRKSERIGRMRHRANFVTQTNTRDGIGGEQLTWVAGDDFWCNVEYMRAGTDDDVIGDRITNVTTAIATMRYVQVDPKDRFRFDGFDWDITRVMPDSHKRYVQIEITNYRVKQELLDDEGDALIDDEGDSLIG